MELSTLDRIRSRSHDHSQLLLARALYLVGPVYRLTLGRFAAFNLSNGAISLLGNIGSMKLLAGVFGMNYFLANVIAIAACSLLNFAVGDRFVFTNPDRQSQST